MKEDLIQALIRTKELTETVRSCHQRGLLCFCLPQACLPSEAARWDNRTDIYRIGTLLFTALIQREDGSRVPFRQAYYREIGNFLATSALWRGITPNARRSSEPLLHEILRRCLSPRPQGRYGCCEELAAALEQVIGMLTPIQTSAS